MSNSTKQVVTMGNAFFEIVVREVHNYRFYSATNVANRFHAFRLVKVIK